MVQKALIYKELTKKDLQVAFLYFILKSDNNENVISWLQKHSKENDEMIQTASSGLQEFRTKIHTTLMGELSEYSCSYYNDNNLSSIGKFYLFGFVKAGHMH